MADLVLKVQGIAKEPDTVSADQEVDEIFKVILNIYLFNLL